MDIAGYVSVCVQLYCVLVFAVFHYMFRPTWPSSSVKDSLYIYFRTLKDSASLLFPFAAFFSRGHTLYVFHLCFVPVLFSFRVFFSAGFFIVVVCLFCAAQNRVSVNNIVSIRNLSIKFRDWSYSPRPVA
jgi:hypothetical protein